MATRPAGVPGGAGVEREDARQGGGAAADEVVVDLEDGVASDAKEEARSRLGDAAARGTLAIRINGVRTPWWRDDLAAVAERRPDVVVVPKVESAGRRRTPSPRCFPTGIALEVQIETARGLVEVERIAAAGGPLEALVFGPGDFAASLGIPVLTIGAGSFDYALARISVAAHAYGLQAVDGPYADLGDLDGLRAARGGARARLRREVGRPPRPDRAGDAGAHADREIEYGPFERRIELGEDVDPTRASATYERGMLRIVLPLAQQVAEQTKIVDRGAPMTEPELVVVSPDEQQHAEELGDELPATLPVLPLKETVVFPESMTPLAIGQERSIKLIDDVVGGDRLLALVTVRERRRRGAGLGRPLRGRHGRGRAQDDPRPRRDAAHPRPGPAARSGSSAASTDDPYLVARVRRAARRRRGDEGGRGADAERAGPLRADHRRSSPYLPEELQLAAANVDDPSALRHLVASTLRLKTEEKQKLLELVDVEERLREVSLILNRELEVFELGTKIQSQVQSELEKGQREFFLRQQLKAIQEELGEGDPEQAEVERAARAARRARAARGRARRRRDRELARLERLPSAAAEYGVIRTYLDWIATLPWSEDDDGQPRPRARARRSSTRTTTTSRR